MCASNHQIIHDSSGFVRHGIATWIVITSLRLNGWSVSKSTRCFGLKLSLSTAWKCDGKWHSHSYTGTISLFCSPSLSLCTLPSLYPSTHYCVWRLLLKFCQTSFLISHLPREYISSWCNSYDVTVFVKYLESHRAMVLAYQKKKQTNFCNTCMSKKIYPFTSDNSMPTYYHLNYQCYTEIDSSRWSQLPQVHVHSKITLVQNEQASLQS